MIANQSIKLRLLVWLAAMLTPFFSVLSAQDADFRILETL